MTQLNFDANTVAPDTGVLDAIPAGWYDAMIDQTEMKPTKDGTGYYLETRFNIMSGQYQGRKLYARLNLRNSNPQAQEIAYKQLSAICHAVGVLQVADSQQLHGIPMKVKVKVRPASGDYEASNEISAFRNINEPVGGPTAGAAPMGGAPAQPTAPAAWGAAQPAPAAPMVPPAAPRAPMQPPASPEQQWQQPAAQQPWQQPPAAPAQQPAQQPWQAAPAQQPPQVQQQPPAAAQPAAQAAPHPAQAAVPPWAQQPPQQ